LLPEKNSTHKVHGWCVLQGHVVAEQQIKLSAQHYLDQLPQQISSEPDYEQQAAPLTVNWQEENGRDSVTIQGMRIPVFKLLLWMHDH